MPINASKPAEPKESPFYPLATGDPRLMFEQFQGINTETSRMGVPDEQMSWCDGFMPIAPRKLRTLPGTGGIIWTAPATIVLFYFINIEETRYAIVFLSTGAIWAVNTDTVSASEIAVAGTITGPTSDDIGITQHGADLAIIVTGGQANGYFLWDGTTFYSPGDTVSAAIDPGLGTVPTGINGTSVEIFEGRVWITQDDFLTGSAPGSVIDFTTVNGGINEKASDSFLRTRYTRVMQINGFLYLIGDSSINWISNVQTTGSGPAVTSFTNKNADSESGTPWAWSVLTFGRGIIFANSFGIHALNGSTVTKISDHLDGIYNPDNLIFNPSSAKATVFNKKVWMLLFTIVDPVSGQTRNKLLMWNGRYWWASEQEVDLVFIANQEIDSNLIAWGTDGTSLYRLFDDITADFVKTAQTRFWEAPGGYEFVKAATRIFGVLQYNDPRAPNLEVDIDNEIDTAVGTVELSPLAMIWTNNSSVVMVWTNNLAQTMVWSISGGGLVVIPPFAVGQQGVMLGMTMRTSSPDMTIISMQLSPQIVAYRG